MTRQRKTWRELLSIISPPSAIAKRTAKIEAFVAAHGYDLGLNLHGCADSLYEDVGAIAMTLIQLRYKQAEQKVRTSMTVAAAGIGKAGRPAKSS
jgi:hypothetical protein